ncbi:MAG: hypothetical protein OXF06_04725 [Bacteroidetes bacterium]|nr:hypothetical protein [Bacteroidota bacterium]
MTVYNGLSQYLIDEYDAPLEKEEDVTILLEDEEMKWSDHNMNFVELCEAQKKFNLQ